MTELGLLLESATGDPIEVDRAVVSDDVRRGRRALTRTRRTRWAGVAVAAVVLVAGIGAANRLASTSDRGPEPTSRSSSLPWPRWSLDFAPDAVMPRSSAPVELTILGTTRPLDPGRAVERDGRTFYVGRYGSKDIVVARDRLGVWVEAVVPNPPGWTLQQSVDLLAGVRVTNRLPDTSD
jgi:hypothetical protein